MGIIIDFSFQTCLGSARAGNFTNFLKSQSEFADMLSHILGKMIVELSTKELKEISRNRAYHTHLLRNKTELAIDILREILKNEFDYEKEDAEKWLDNNGIFLQELWQISCPDSHGIRLIGFFQDNIHFRVLFIDYYHQIYPDEKNNQENIEANEFSALKNLKGR